VWSKPYGVERDENGMEVHDASAICQKLAFTMEQIMKTKLILAICAALFLSTAASATQTDDQSGSATVQTVKTVTTVQHVNGTNATWYRPGGVVPDEYRGDTYVVHHWQDEHLNEPAAGSHWVRGNNGDFLLVDDDSGAITSIVQTPQH
jgi:Nickel/cobalt transporter regulator